MKVVVAVLGSPSITELRSCVKVEVDDLGSPSIIFLTVSVDVKKHLKNVLQYRAQKLCERRSGRPGLPRP